MNNVQAQQLLAARICQTLRDRAVTTSQRQQAEAICTQFTQLAKLGQLHTYPGMEEFVLPDMNNCGCGPGFIDDVAEQVYDRRRAAQQGQAFGRPNRNRYTAAVIGDRGRTPGKGGIITSETLTIPSSSGSTGWTGQVVFSDANERVLSGQEICDLSILGIEDPMYAAQIYLTLRVNGRDDFGGVVDLPLNRAIGTVFDPQNRIRLSADNPRHAGPVSGGPVLPSDSILVGHVYVPPNVTFDMDQQLQLQVSAGLCY